MRECEDRDERGVLVRGRESEDRDERGVSVRGRESGRA